MKKVASIFLILSFILISNSCNKEEEITIAGNKKEDPSGIPYSNYPVFVTNSTIGYDGVYLKYAEISDRGEVAVTGLAQDDFVGYISANNKFNCVLSEDVGYSYPTFDVDYNFIQLVFKERFYGFDPISCSRTWESPEFSSWPGLPTGASIQAEQSSIQTKNKMRFIAFNWYYQGIFTLSLGAYSVNDNSINHIQNLSGYSLIDLVPLGENRIGLFVLNKSDLERKIMVFDTNLQLKNDEHIETYSFGDFQFETKNKNGQIDGFLWGSLLEGSKSVTINKLDTNGELLWDKSINYGDTYLEVTAVGPSQYGGFTMIARHYNYTDFSVLLYDENGVLIKTIPIPKSEYLNYDEDYMHVRQISDGTIVVVAVGYDDSNRGIFISRINAPD